MKPIFLLCMLILTILRAFSQNTDLLEPVEDALGGLFGTEQKISQVRLLGETEETVNLEVKLEGFNKEKTYVIKGSILTKSKRKIKEIPSVSRELSGSTQSIDLGFSYQTNSKSSRSSPYVSSQFVRISIDEKDENSLFDDSILGDTDLISLDGVSQLYIYPKDWRVGSGEGMVIDIILTPIGAARKNNP